MPGPEGRRAPTRGELKGVRDMARRGAATLGGSNLQVSPRAGNLALSGDNTLTELCEIQHKQDPPAWAAGTKYEAGNAVIHNAQNYRCIKAHTATAGAAGNEPGIGAGAGAVWVMAYNTYLCYVLDPQTGDRVVDDVWPVWIDDSQSGELKSPYRGYLGISQWGDLYMTVTGGMDGALCTAWIDNNQNIPNGVWTKLLLNQTMYNYGGHFNVVNNRFDVPEAGVYQFACSVNFRDNGNWNAGDTIGVYLYVNGAAAPGAWAWHNQQSAFRSASLTRDLELAAGDFVEMWVYQTSGAACVVNGAPANSDRGMWLSISKLAKGGGAPGMAIREEDWFWMSTHYNNLFANNVARMEPGLTPSNFNSGNPYDYYDMTTSVVKSIRAQHHLTPAAGAVDFQVGRWSVAAAAYVWEANIITIAAGAVSARRDDLNFPIPAGDWLAFQTTCNAAYLPPMAVDHCFAGAKVIGEI